MRSLHSHLKMLVLLGFALILLACGIGEFKVVAVLPQTGQLAVYGGDVKQGMETAAKMLNAGGGVLDGKQIQLSFEDDGSDAAQSAMKVRAAFDGGAYAVLGPLGDDALFAAGTALLADDSKKIKEVNGAMISPWSVAPLAPRGMESLHRIYPAATVEGSRLAKHVRRGVDPPVKDIVLLTALSDTGRAYKASFAITFKRLNGNVERSVNFTPGLDAESAAELVADLRTKPAGGVFIIASGADNVQLLKALEGIGYQEPVFTTSSFHHRELRAEAGAASEGVSYVVMDWDSESERSRAFVAAYTKDHGMAPSLWAVLGHDAVMTLASAAESQKGFYTDELSSKLRALNFKSERAAIRLTSFDTNGECAECPCNVVAVQDGDVLAWADSKGAGS